MTEANSRTGSDATHVVHPRMGARAGAHVGRSACHGVAEQRIPKRFPELHSYFWFRARFAVSHWSSSSSRGAVHRGWSRNPQRGDAGRDVQAGQRHPIHVPASPDPRPGITRSTSRHHPIHVPASPDPRPGITGEGADLAGDRHRSGPRGSGDAGRFFRTRPRSHLSGSRPPAVPRAYAAPPGHLRGQCAQRGFPGRQASVASPPWGDRSRCRRRLRSVPGGPR